MEKKFHRNNQNLLVKMAQLITINKNVLWLRDFDLFYTLLIRESKKKIMTNFESQCFRVYLRSCDQRVRDEFDFCSQLNSQHIIWIVWWCYNVPVYIRYDFDIVVIISSPLNFCKTNERTNEWLCSPVYYFSIERNKKKM